MSDELRAAAERLRKHVSVPYTKSPYFFSDDHYHPGLIDHKRVDADKSLLANAYLAEHHADDDAAVNHWWYAEKEPLKVRWSPVQLWIETYSGESFVIKDNPTNGDVRRLLAALGIEVRK